MVKQRQLDERELRLRFYLPDQTIHVYRVGLASGTYKGACLDAQRLQSQGHGYLELPFLRWVYERGPVCPVCLKRLAIEGIERQLTPVSNTGVNSEERGQQ
jgi:hypothetical protein